MMDYDLIYRKDARHAVLHNEGQAAVAAIEEIPAVEMRPQIYGYDLENLRLFAELCKAQGVTDKDMKNVASDATWAAQAVFDANERAFRQMVTENTENGVVARFAVELPPPINPKRFEHVFDDAKTVKLPKLNVEFPKRLIDANALIPKMRERFWKRGREGDAVCLIEDAPEIDAEPVLHGHWQIEQHDRWLYPRCNLCGKLQDVKSNYCPNCGAKMKGEDDADS